MNILTRRSFIKRSGLGALGMAIGSLLNVPGFLREAVAGGGPITWNGNKILFVFLRGGNDCLNTIMPHGDTAFNAGIRPTLFVPPPDDPLSTSGQCPLAPQGGRAIDLGNGFATLHPSMIDMCPLYNSGELAMIHRVGYPNQSRSHFDSENYWETGLPRNNGNNDGVFYRALVETGLHESQVLPAVSLNDTMPLLIRGDVPFANINDPSRFDLLGVYAQARQKHIEHISNMHGFPYPAKNNRKLVFPTGERFVNSIEAIEGIDFTDNDSPEFIDTATGYHLFQIDPNFSEEKGFDSWTARNFFRSLKYSCQILGNTDAVISGTELGGFDTHDDQGGLTGSHADRMAWIGWAMHALKEYMSHPNVDIWDNTIVVTLTEFGRTTIENGSNGTDHAEAGVMLVSGGPVTGGVYQCDANGSDPETRWNTGDAAAGGTMFGVNGRYLKRSVDYRSVLGELIRDHLGATQTHLDKVIPGYANASEALKSGGVTIDGTHIVGELGILA